MRVNWLSLTDFRSYEHLEVDLPPGASALIGPNGQGKTNLIEAIGYASTLASHRVSGDAALVRSGASRAVVRLRAQRAERASLVELEINPGRANRAQLNRAPVRRPRDVLGVVRTVVFAPEDLALVKGEPEGRRRFLDELNVQLSPRLAGVLADYERILRQRNALLKSARPTRHAPAPDGELPTLEVWDAKLAQTGAELLAARLRLVGDLQPWVAQAYTQVSGSGGEVALRYRSSLADDDAADDDAAPDGGSLTSAPAQVEQLRAAMLKAMARLRRQEIERGLSLVGPHRDDLVLGLGGLPAKGFASHGESWSLALALRLGCYRLLTKGSDEGQGPPGGESVPGWAEGSEPVLILDDVFAELDVGRRGRLAALVGAAEQVLVTAAVAQDVPEELAGARYEVAAGEVRRVR